MKRPPARWRIGGRTWRIVSLATARREGWAGGDDDGAVSWERGAIAIPAGGNTPEDLATIMHEACGHVATGCHCEVVPEACEDVARLLIRLGWRKEA